MRGAFVGRLEEVRGLGARPEGAQGPGVCSDELRKALRAEVRTGLPVAPGRPARHDGEYQRGGTANRSLVTCASVGWRRIAVTGRRTALDVAQPMKRRADADFPQAEAARLGLDNLNPPPKGSLSEAFPAEEAKRIAGRLEVIYTPKRASWLDRAEREWSVLVRPSWGRRIGDRDVLCREVAAWERARNAQRVKVNGCFGVADARVKRSQLYPAKL